LAGSDAVLAGRLLASLGASVEDPPPQDDLDRIQRAINYVKDLRQTANAKRAKMQLASNASTAALTLGGGHLDLPLAVAIVLFLDPRSKFAVARTCRDFQVVVVSPHAWPVLEWGYSSTRMPSSKLKDLLQRPSFSLLRHLTIPQCPVSKSLFKDSFSPYVPHLISLDLSRVSGKIKAAHIGDLIATLKSPASLQFFCSARRPLHEYQPLLCACINIVTIELTWWLEDAKREQVGGSHLRSATALLGGLTKLKSLSLDQRSYSKDYRPSQDPFDDSCFLPVWESCKELQALELKGIYRLTNASWNKIAACCPNMKAIALESQLADFTDTVLWEDIDREVSSCFVQTGLCSISSLVFLTVNVVRGYAFRRTSADFVDPDEFPCNMGEGTLRELVRWVNETYGRSLLFSQDLYMQAEHLFEGTEISFSNERVTISGDSSKELRRYQDCGRLSALYE
jgi:hypothetical protein